jgi:ASC-1-like (ASCH) protein
MEINVAQPWFRHIQRRRKTVEGRLDKNKFSELSRGSVLIISSNQSKEEEKVVAVVTRVKKYPDFRTYLTQEGLARTLPGIETIEEGVSVYRQFYTEAQEREHGVLAVHIRLVL